MLSYLSQTKRDTYTAFHIEKKSLSEISVSRGLVESTLIGHLADALAIGLPLDLSRVNVTRQMVEMVEEKIRKPPINSSNFILYGRDNYNFKEN